MSNTSLWERHRTPPRDALKSFKKAGGFGGTSIDPMWLILEATREWGEIGCGWGYDVISEAIERLDDGWVLHTCNINLWYVNQTSSVGRVPSTGNTWLVMTTKAGEKRYDDEASKKSRTDAISKALSWLGFGADIYMGIHDGNKYADLFDSPAVEETEATSVPPEHDLWPISAVPPEDDTWEDTTELSNTIKNNIKIGIDKMGEDVYKIWHKRVLQNMFGVDTVKELTDAESMRRFVVMQDERFQLEKG